MMRLQKRFSTLVLKRDTNQARALGEYAIDFLKNGTPNMSVLHRTKLFHTDSVICGVSALAQRTNAPTVLKQDAIANYPHKAGATCFGSTTKVQVEKAICANSSAVREWDSNGTVFGYRKERAECQAGEFGHNDYYPVIMACAQINPAINGQQALQAMVLNDEIRGRLAEVFSLKSYKIDHVVHGAISSVATYGALMGATPLEIEHAIGMFVAHYIPFRAIRAGKQLSDSKGASAALSTEAAISCIKRAMQGFVGPKDIFRNPEAIFRYFEKTEGDVSPFDIHVAQGGEDFSIMGMHFKLGLYEHQSAGAIEGILSLMNSTSLPQAGLESVDRIKVTSYEPAFGIIGDPAKRSPTTRQSADHSMVYILSRLIKKAMDNAKLFQKPLSLDQVWKQMILLPQDFGAEALNCPATRDIMMKIDFEHGGPEYDSKYPDGIPTRVEVMLKDGQHLDSGFVMYPSGHARNTTCDLEGILANKFNLLGRQALTPKSLATKLEQLNNLENLSNSDLVSLYNCKIQYADKSIDA